jgi:hypothetical protein
VKHLHVFVRETNLTEAEFQNIARITARLGQLSDESHNEVVLIAGSLGVSSLVCLLDNGVRGDAALVGHYVKQDTDTEPAPDPGVTGTWYPFDHTYIVEPGDTSLPKRPITGKATAGVSVSEVLERTPQHQQMDLEELCG